MSEKFYCEYCGEGFSSVSSLTSEDCPRHPNGSNKGKHKLYEGREKSQFISRVKTFWNMYLTLLIVFGISYVFIVGGIENQYFIRRSLYYWANSYSSLLNKSENYTKLSPVISINVLDFTLFNDIDDFHSCYLLKEIKHNKILTDHCMLHYIKLPKFNLNNDKEKLSSWIKFFKGGEYVKFNKRE